MDTSSKIENEVFPLSDLLKNIERPRRRKIADPFLTGLIVDKTLEQIIMELPLPESQLEKGINVYLVKVIRKSLITRV